ncbi:MAG TPA: DmsC/YnfH family molybdoenzyme membrane anchor subunit [Casimicrobiaceae bacterium]|nr:DmsC/YnfH family molybdoenzyme membrane anchor subunit [Casimicrobiaceae bacterium]
MKPSFSIIFFTVSSGAGLGLLALLALGDLLDRALPSDALIQGIAVALVLVAAGLTSSVLHLAKPANAWRAFSRFRTSWLSREAMLAACLFPVAFAYGVLAWTAGNGPARALAALGVALLAWAVLVSTAMIYASLKPIRQWHSAWTPVNYLLLGHWSGAVLLLGLARVHAAHERSLGWLAGGLGVAALIAKIGQWRAITAGARDAPTLERAIGVREGVRPPGMTVARARLFDVGHSHGTFLTDEFGFVLARRHAVALRIAALTAGFGVPAAWIVSGAANAAVAWLAAIVCLAGLLAERWLFFAEAQHTVRLYHGAPRT